VKARERAKWNRNGEREAESLDKGIPYIAKGITRVMKIRPLEHGI